MINMARLQMAKCLFQISGLPMNLVQIYRECSGRTTLALGWAGEEQTLSLNIFSSNESYDQILRSG